MEKFYVEFENTEDQNPFCLQSVWFDTKEDAINWYIKYFDFVEMDTMCVHVVKGEVDILGNVDNTSFVEDITAKFNLRKDRL